MPMAKGYPNRAEKTDRRGIPPTRNTLAQMMGGSMGGPGATPLSVPGMPSGYMLTGKNQTQFGTDNHYQVGYASAPQMPTNPALGAINRNVSAPFVDDGSITPLSSKTIYAQNPGMVWNGSQMVPQGGRQPVSLQIGGSYRDEIGPGAKLSDLLQMIRGGANGGNSLPPLPTSASGTMQPTGGLSLPFFTPKKAALPDLGAALGSLFKRTPMPKQLPMPSRIPRGSRGTAAGNDGARETTTKIQRDNYDRQGIAY